MRDNLFNDIIKSNELFLLVSLVQLRVSRDFFLETYIKHTISQWSQKLE